MHDAMASRRRLAAVAALMVALLSVLVAYNLSAGAAPQAAQTVTAVPDSPSIGRQETCTVNTSSNCTVSIAFGVVPAAVDIQEQGPGQNATVLSSTVTATSYVIKWRWHDGTGFPANTTFTYYAHYDFPAGTSPSPSPTATATTTAPPPTTSAPPPTTSAPPPTTSAPPPTTTAPSPSPTGSVSPVKTCTNGDTIGEGAGLSYFEPDGSEYFVHNNNWNDNYGGSHTITACNYDNWYLTTNIPAHGDNAVEAYPNVHRDYNDKPLSGITSARFAAKAPVCTSSLKYNVAFDIWIGSGFNNELMIWTENCNQRPAGNQVGTTVIGGQTYEVWKEGAGAGGIFSYVATPRMLFGTMPLNLFWDDLNRRGWINGSQTTWQVDFGVETVYTSGTTQRFDFTDFYINDTAGSTAAATTREKVAKQHLHALGRDR